MIQAGAKPVNWVVRHLRMGPRLRLAGTKPSQRMWSFSTAGASSLTAQYMLAQVSAGLVPAPSWALETASS